MDGRWRIEMLGGLRATLGDRVVSRFRSHQTGGLLASLAFDQHRAHPREELIERLWPECEPDAGRNRFRVALSSLRRQLEPPGVPPGAVLVADRASIRLNPAAAVTDVALFEAALRAADRAPGAVEKQARLTEAIEQYRGELLPGYFDEWIFPERRRLAEAFAQALHELTALLAQSGDLARALQFGHRAVGADPLRQEAHHDLIRLLIAAGQPDDALRQYRELERLLDQELGTTPSPEIRDLVRRAVRNHHGAGAPKAPPLRGEAAPSLPSGTVTFLLAEVDGAIHPGDEDASSETRAGCRELLGEFIRQHRGHEASPGGGGGGGDPRTTFVVLFQRAGEALACAVAAQRALSEHASPPQVRMALHTGDRAPDTPDDSGPALRRARQLLPAGHGAQILCSEETAALVRRELAEGVRLVDLGAYHLPGAAAPERLFRVEYPEILGRQFPPPRATPVAAGHVPLQFTRFFGREAEIEQLCQALGCRPSAVGQAESALTDGRQPAADGPRLITLTGPGGSGKTRLALEIAARLRDRFQEAVWFVSLVDVADPRLILSKILDTMRLPRSQQLEPLGEVASFLSARGAETRGSLLVLDNFEHLVTEGAAVVRMLLERVPTLTVLVTSRQYLGLPGEQEFPLAPLPVPASVFGVGCSVFGRASPNTADRTPNTEHLISCPSVRLFVDRAQAVRPDFQVTPGNAAAVAALCQRLEGIPLALELAAARARMLTPAQMLSRLDQRFELLTSRHRDADQRHRSLRATLDWSYQLLTPELRRFFAQLSVFRGGWSLEAAEAVCEEPGALEYLEQLQESSLVLAEDTSGVQAFRRSGVREGRAEDLNARTPERLNDGMRYRLLETLREYGEEQLGPEERAALKERHAAYYLAVAEEAEPGLLGPDQRARLAQLEEEHENLRAALDWAVEAVGSRPSAISGGRPVVASDGRRPRADSPSEIGLRLGGALWWFWTARGNLAEGRERLARLLALEPGDGRQPAGDSSDPATIDGLEGGRSAESVACRLSSGASTARAKAQLCAAVLAQLQGDHGASRSLYEECLARAREGGDGWAIALSLTGLGFLAQFHGDNPAARSLLEQSLPVWQEIGQPWGTALALNGLADVDVGEGDFAAALALFEESLAIRRRLGDQWGIAVSVSGLGHLARERGDWATARALYEESLTIRRELGDRWGIAECLEDVAALAVAAGSDAGTTARLLGAAAALRAAIGTPIRPANRAGYERHLAATRTGLGEAAFAEAWASGYRLTWEQAVTAALAWLGTAMSDER